MKTKYTFTVNGIKTELEFDYELDAKKDSEFIRYQIEQQHKLLSSIDRQKLCKNTISTEQLQNSADKISEAVENLFLDSLKDLAEEFTEIKNKNNISVKK